MQLRWNINSTLSSSPIVFVSEDEKSEIRKDSGENRITRIPSSGNTQADPGQLHQCLRGTPSYGHQ